jgi:DMSO/TMAO reductase YedYZ molybdopterin-dependent catalytic subunit
MLGANLRGLVLHDGDVTLRPLRVRDMAYSKPGSGGGTSAAPTPAVAAAPIPAGAEIGVRGVSALVTPNGSFYRIDTALQVPIIDAETWRLRITGMVEEEIELSYADLLALPLQESVITLMCVSNEVGGSLIGNAVWLGYPIREVLKRAKPMAGADMVLSRTDDGFTASSPLSVLLEEDRDCLLAVGMNGEPLPLEHGFPVRMVVPGLYGYVSATKWVTELKVTRFAFEAAYWTQRGWSPLGPGAYVDVGDVTLRPAGRLPAVPSKRWGSPTRLPRGERASRRMAGLVPAGAAGPGDAPQGGAPGHPR